MKIWNLAIRQPVFMSMILTAGVVLGVFSYFRMPVSLFPDVEFPVVIVNTIYPGASADEIEEQVTSLLEDELSTLSGIDTVESTSSEGVSTIVLQFDLEVALDKASQDVRERVGNLTNQLPSGILAPVIQTFDPNALPIISLGVADRTGELSPLALRALVEDKVQAPLETVPGVSAVDVGGGQVREIQVNLDLKALEARRISPQQVVGVLQSENINLPGGTVGDDELELLVRTPANFQTLEDIRNVIISQRGAPIYLRDVAEVVDGLEESDTLTRLNGEDAVVLNVRKQSAGNSVAIAHEVKETIAEIGEANANLELVLLSDQSLDIEASTDGALEDLFWGALLASLVMLVFFRDFRNTFVTIAGLPVIMIATIFFMDAAGIGLNQISLLALALVVGLVIDDAIVVRENILRWVEKGYSPRQAASLGTAEVVLAVLATGATILCVFLPVAYATGIIGRFFREFGLTVSIAMLVSTFEALTLAPMLSAHFFRPKTNQAAYGIEEDEDEDLDQLDPSKVEHFEEAAGDNWLNRVYGGLLGWTLRHKFITVLLALAIMVASFASVALVEVGFLPASNSYQFGISMRLPPGTPLATTTGEAVRVEEILRSHPAVGDVVTTIGGTGSPEEAAFTVILHGNESRTVTAKTVSNELRRPLANVPGILFVTGEGGFGGETDIQVQVVGLEGTEYAVLDQEAQQLAEAMRQIPGLVDVDVSYKPGRPEMQLAIDRKMAAQMGLSAAQIASTVRLLVNGEQVSTFRGEGPEAEIRVQQQQASSSNIDTILNLNLVTPSGALAPLRTLVQVKSAEGPSQIQHSDRRPVISVSANVVERSIPSANTEVNNLLASIQPALPPGVEARQGGDFEAQGEAMMSLLVALLLGVLFIYMVLASQFGSLIQPLLIMLAMPLAVIGAILALVITGSTLDMMAMIGFIMLMGLVTKNSILLVDFANRQRAQGSNASEAMRAAGPVRLRPVLMTSFALILAMIPVALGLSAGGEFRRTMAIAIMGGMITSTFLTLLIVPVFYAIVVGFQDRLTARRAAKRRRQDERMVQPVADSAAPAD
jgi:HAE1 family hydrophobic/amphiphilic exporter-1